MVSATTFTKEYGHAVSLLIMVYFYSVAREGARVVGEVFDDGDQQLFPGEVLLEVVAQQRRRVHDHMHIRTLGQQGLTVSALGYGFMGINFAYCPSWTSTSPTDLAGHRRYPARLGPGHNCSGPPTRAQEAGSAAPSHLPGGIRPTCGGPDHRHGPVCSEFGPCIGRTAGVRCAAGLRQQVRRLWVSV
jgi:hypothetical protein